MLQRLSSKRTGFEQQTMPFKKIKIDYGYLKDYNKVKNLSLQTLEKIPLYRKLEQAPKFVETNKAITFMHNDNAYTEEFDKFEDTYKGLNCLVLDRLLKNSALNIGKQNNTKEINKLTKSLKVLSEIPYVDILNLKVKQNYTSKDLAYNVYSIIKNDPDVLQDEILNSFNMYLIDDGTGNSCQKGEINRSHLTIFGYPKDYSSMAVSVDSPILNQLIDIEYHNKIYNKVENLEINTKNENLKNCVQDIIKTYPELITMFDTSLKKHNGIESLKNSLMSIKALYENPLFKSLHIGQKNILISAILLDNISQSSEADENDRIVQNANDAFSITNKYFNLEDRKLIANLILVNPKMDMLNYACGLDHSFDLGERIDFKNNRILQNKMDDSIATMFKGDNIYLYFLFQQYKKNNKLDSQKIRKLANHAAIAHNIDLMVREALDVTTLPNNANLLYLNCKLNNASCIKDGILTKDKNGFVSIDISKMQNGKLPKEIQKQYFKEMGINCKSVEDFRLLIHGNRDLNPSYVKFEFNDEYLPCDAQRAIINMVSMENHQLGYQRLCTTFISNDNNNIFSESKIGFIIDPSKTTFLNAHYLDNLIASKDSYSVHIANTIYNECLQSKDLDKLNIRPMNSNEIKQNFAQQISDMRKEMFKPSAYYTEVSVANVNVAGFVIGGNINEEEIDPYEILKLDSVADYIKSKNIPIIKINLNSTMSDE